jgi:hypothetical protein
MAEPIQADGFRFEVDLAEGGTCVALGIESPEETGEVHFDEDGARELGLRLLSAAGALKQRRDMWRQLVNGITSADPTVEGGGRSSASSEQVGS